MDVKKIEFAKNLISKASHKVRSNDIISEFYKIMYSEFGFEKYVRRAESVKGCFKLWDIECYKKQKIKDVLHINCCKDKFCRNCQNTLSLRRLLKYKPELMRLTESYDVYHIVFTVPNVDGASLNLTIDKMFKKFTYIMRYFQGERKAVGVDFKKYGFVGAVRSLEITTKKIYDNYYEYHPHFHCLFILKKGLSNDKKIINDYSFNGKKSIRKFTDFEILLQKSWYLFYNGEKLTATALLNLNQGYSVTADKSNNNYHEVFKYTLKGSFKDGSIYNYEIFKTCCISKMRNNIICRER